MLPVSSIQKPIGQNAGSTRRPRITLWERTKNFFRSKWTWGISATGTGVGLITYLSGLGVTNIDIYSGLNFYDAGTALMVIFGLLLGGKIIYTCISYKSEIPEQLALLTAPRVGTIPNFEDDTEPGLEVVNTSSGLSSSRATTTNLNYGSARVSSTTSRNFSTSSLGSEEKDKPIDHLIVLANLYAVGEKKADSDNDLVAQINIFTDRIKGYPTTGSSTPTPSISTTVSVPAMPSAPASYSLGGGYMDFGMASFSAGGTIYGTPIGSSPDSSPISSASQNILSMETSDITSPSQSQVELGTQEGLSILLSTLKKIPDLANRKALDDAVKRLMQKLQNLGGVLAGIVNQTVSGSSLVLPPASSYASTMLSLTTCQRLYLHLYRCRCLYQFLLVAH